MNPSPIAWQEIEGEIRPVDVAFEPWGAHRIGFRVGRYDPAHFLHSADPEILHVDEALDVLLLGPHVFAQQVTSRGVDTSALRRLSPEYASLLEWGW